MQTTAVIAGSHSAKETIRMSNSSDDPLEEVVDQLSDQTQWGIVAVAFLLGGSMGLFSNPTEPTYGFFLFGVTFGGATWLVLTDSGRQFRQEFSEFKEEIAEEIDETKQQQQQIPSSSKPKIICGNCGWQNPKGNNYCHDCGEEVGV